MSTATQSRILPPPGNGLPAKVVPIAPNQTLYVRNLPSAKIKKEDLRMALYLLFSTYGPVLDVVALKTMKMRGQAHIVFRDIQAATQAARSLDGFSFFGQDMKVTYAKSKSNVIARLDGTFEPPTAAQTVEVTDLQQSIFNAPAPGSAATPPPVVPKPADAPGGTKADAEAEAARGQKRTRDEEDEEEDDDSDVARGGRQR
ncbi:RNA-binding domain containing protein [Grosmannia clavigera kw1407]|uniref:RNA-binding domain containing protein n=1 Tax=Grosmannia clavigera (strain kw1407 / UAMH 11150) TaxID=655863 RepID=F0XLJ1_GROCL|nr:RNA-binding domain containing protein [Grosmannia clavigera kw1407]EFX01045.1 RNA-binding domain containing protein [Grosmannia clavigera kw1407]